MDEWDEDMEHLEEQEDAEADMVERAAAGAQGENDADADVAAEEDESIIEDVAAKARNSDDGEIRKALDILIMDNLAREDGEKPADEWTRNDFRHLSRHHPELKNLTISELRALFLVPTRTIGGVLYCHRGDVREVRRRRRDGEKPFYTLGISPAASYAAEHAYPGAFQWLEDEKKKLAAIWREL